MLNTNRKYLCKKSSICCVKGSYYDVDFLITSFVSMVVENSFNESFTFNSNYTNYRKFYEHFYTEQEERKLKIEQLKND